MKFRSYNREIKIATALVENVFNNIVISRMDRNAKSSKEIKVPLVYGARPRVLKELENPKKTIKPPLVALVKEGMSSDSDRMSDLYSYKREVPDGYVALERMKAIPMNVEFTLSGIAEYEDDVDQIVSNFVVFFKPDIFVSWKHPQYQKVEIRSQLVWNGRIQNQYPTEVRTDANEFYQFETSFTFKTWFFPGFMGGGSGEDGLPLIEKVNFSASSDFFSVGDAGYGVVGLHAVPQVLSFAEYVRMVNDGLVGDGEAISVPRIVNPPSHDMMVCYPVHTRRDAVTVKVTYLGDVGDDLPGRDVDAFGFDSESSYGDCTVYHFSAVMNEREDSGRHRYEAAATTTDGQFTFTVSSVLDTNHAVGTPTAPFGPVTCPVDPDAMTSEEWRITSGNGTVLSLFSDSGEFVASKVEPVTWENLGGNLLNVKRVCVDAGEDFSKAPRRAVVEGLLPDGRTWTTSKMIDFGEWTYAHERKYFDYDDDARSYAALRVTFSVPEDGETVVGRFRCYSSTSYVDGSVGAARMLDSTSMYMVSVSMQDGSALMVSRTSSSMNSNPGLTSAVSTGLLSVENDGVVDLDVPSLEEVEPVRFAPMRYLIFSYGGRRYGLSTEGGFGSGAFLAQTITYGYQLPASAVDGSVHVLTNSPGLPMYQYDGTHGVWFSIGNQSRPGIQRASYADEVFIDAVHPVAQVPFGVCVFGEVQLCASFRATSSVDAEITIRITCGTSSVVRSFRSGAAGVQSSVQFMASGTGADSTVLLELVSGVPFTMSDVIISGRFEESDFITDPESASPSVVSFLEGGI